MSVWEAIVDDYAEKKQVLDRIYTRLAELDGKNDDSISPHRIGEMLVLQMPLERVRALETIIRNEQSPSAILMAMARENLHWHQEQRDARLKLN